MNNQKKIIERLIKNNTRLHEDLKVLRIVLTQEDSKEREDLFIVHHKDCNQSDNELTNEHEHAELVSRMCMQAI